SRRWLSPHFLEALPHRLADVEPGGIRAHMLRYRVVQVGFGKRSSHEDSFMEEQLCGPIAFPAFLRIASQRRLPTMNGCFPTSRSVLAGLAVRSRWSVRMRKSVRDGSEELPIE